MILEPGPNARPHFFLVGWRAPSGGMVAGAAAERVGVLVARDVIGFDGSALDAGDVLTSDQPFVATDSSGPFRLEAEIVTAKPVPDVVVVHDKAASEAAAAFGSVRIDRGAGFGIAHARVFGWLPRGDNPRLPLAGDPAALAAFDPAQDDLPEGYDNAFSNGAPLTGEAPFDAGNRLQFVDTTGPLVSTMLVIPPAPQLRATHDGQPVDPPLPLAPRVDTVVMDRAAATFTVVWRASFAWQDRLLSATLHVD